METLAIKHHGAIQGVTGSCHEICLADNFGILVDCGLFQGAETWGQGASPSRLQIDFPISHIKALVVTHVHIDHVGRIPYLLAAGFKGPIVCSQPSAQLLPLVLEDAVKVGFTRDAELVKRFLGVIRKRVIGIPYKHWFSLLDENARSLRVRLQPAGHILGSAFLSLMCLLIQAGVRAHRRWVPTPSVGVLCFLVIWERLMRLCCRRRSRQIDAILWLLRVLMGIVCMRIGKAERLG